MTTKTYWQPIFSGNEMCNGRWRNAKTGGRGVSTTQSGKIKQPSQVCYSQNYSFDLQALLTHTVFPRSFSSLILQYFPCNIIYHICLFSLKFLFCKEWKHIFCGVPGAFWNTSKLFPDQSFFTHNLKFGKFVKICERFGHLTKFGHKSLWNPFNKCDNNRFLRQIQKFT